MSSYKSTLLDFLLKKGKFIFAYSCKYELNIINKKLILNKGFILNIVTLLQ